MAKQNNDAGRSGTGGKEEGSDGTALEGSLHPFLGEPEMKLEEIFPDERFPNVVVALDGTVIATWGRHNMVVRRSENGGQTWEPAITVGEGIHAGGATVDETTGDVLVFVHPEHPAHDGSTAPRTLYRSADVAKTWRAEEPVCHEDVHGYVPSLHMAEHGITLRRGEHAGRLVRPARVFLTEGGYNTAIYSDDHGQTWRSSQPFPTKGTGEGAIAELSDGKLYYSSRRHRFAEDEPFRHERLSAFSHDSGVSWADAEYSMVLPDGPRYRGIERRGACFNGHFGMAAGLCRLPVWDRDVLIYTNADHEGHERIRMAAWASFDGGNTWPVKRLVYEGPSAYSSVVPGRPRSDSEGWIFLQFEERNAGGLMARLNLSWLVQGEATGDGDVPEWAGS